MKLGPRIASVSTGTPLYSHDNGEEHAQSTELRLISMQLLEGIDSKIESGSMHWRQ